MEAPNRHLAPHRKRRETIFHTFVRIFRDIARTNSIKWYTCLLDLLPYLTFLLISEIYCLQRTTLHYKLYMSYILFLFFFFTSRAFWDLRNLLLQKCPAEIQHMFPLQSPSWAKLLPWGRRSGPAGGVAAGPRGHAWPGRSLSRALPPRWRPGGGVWRRRRRRRRLRGEGGPEGRHLGPCPGAWAPRTARGPSRPGSSGWPCTGARSPWSWSGSDTSPW